MNQIASETEKLILTLRAAPYAQKTARDVVEEATLLAHGGTCDVWLIGEDRVVKIYRDQKGGIPVRKVMKQEWGTFQALEQVPTSPLPTMFAHSEIAAAHEGEACGWAVFSKMRGRHLTLDDTKIDNWEEVWGRRLAEAVVKFETALDMVPEKPDFWSSNDVNARVRWFKELGPISADDQDFIDKLSAYVRQQQAISPNPSRYLHGDVHTQNTFWNESTLTLFDPTVSFEPPESNLRLLLPDHPKLIKAFVDTYSEQTGLNLNPKLIWAFGALEGHRSYLRFVREHGVENVSLVANPELDKCLHRTRRSWIRH